jgi:hypothetical protein
MKLTQAIKTLQDKHPEKWSRYLASDLKNRYYEARKVWGYAARLAIMADRWHEKHSEIYPD